MAEAPETVPLLSNSAAPAEHSIRNPCFRVIREEFVLRNFLFEFQPQEVFYNSQWKVPKALYIFYRLILVAYVTTALILSIVIVDPNRLHRPWPVWLTHWSYLLLTVHLYMALIISLLHFYDGNLRNYLTPDLDDASAPQRNSPVYVKLNWMVFVVACGAAFLVTIVYFSALFPQRGVNYLSTVDINLHLMNSVIVILEFCISAFPLRLMHVVYSWIYGGIYAIFSVIYWSVDHTNVLYPGVLDWNKPGRTVVFLLLLMVIGVPLLHCFLFCLFRFRIWVFHKFYSMNSI